MPAIINSLAISVMPPLVGLLIFLYSQSDLSPEFVGLIVASLIPAEILSSLIQSQFKYSIFRAEREKKLITDIKSLVFFIGTFLTVIFAIASAALYLVCPSNVPLIMVLLFLLLKSIAVIPSYNKYFLEFHHNFDALLTFECISQAGRVILFLILVHFGHPLVAYAVSFIAADIIRAICLFAFASSKILIMKPLVQVIETLAKEAVLQKWRFFSFLNANLGGRLETIVISFLSLEFLGIYSRAQSFSRAFVLVSNQAVARVAAPAIYRSQQTEIRGTITNSTLTVLSINFLLMIFVTFAVFLLANYLSRQWEDLPNILVWLSLAAFIGSQSALYQTVYNSIERSKTAFSISLALQIIRAVAVIATVTINYQRLPEMLFLNSVISFLIIGWKMTVDGLISIVFAFSLFATNLICVSFFYMVLQIL